MPVRSLAAVFMVAALCSFQAKAAPVTISGVGLFGPADIPDPIYQTNTNFSFSFGIDSILSSNMSFDLVAASYTVGGIAVATPIAIVFFDAADGGLFSLGFDDGGTLSFFGEDIGASGNLISGVFKADLFGSAEDFGSAVITVSAIPLPASLPSLGSGLVIAMAVRCRNKWRKNRAHSFHEDAKSWTVNT